MDDGRWTMVYGLWSKYVNLLLNICLDQNPS
jgi:hypothetical protein